MTTGVDLGNCRSCDARVEWAITAKGHRIPLDPEPVAPDARGAMILVPEERLIGTATVALSMVQALERLTVGISEEQARSVIMSTFEARLSHFVTCPNSALWREKHKRGSGLGRRNS